VVLESGRTDADVLAFAQEPVLQVKHLAVPNLVRTVNHSQLARVVIELEELHDFDLEIEIVVLAIFALGANLGHVLELGDVALTKEGVFGEALGNPLSQPVYSLLLRHLKREGLAKIRERLILAWVGGTLN